MKDEPHISDPVPVMAVPLESGALVIVPRTWARKASSVPVVGQYRWVSIGSSISLRSEEDLDEHDPGWRELT